MKYSFYSWNINGIRAVLKKGVLQNLLLARQPDFLCLQETKAKKTQVEVDFLEYQEFWNSADRAGYSGTAIFTKNSQKILSQELNFHTFLEQHLSSETRRLFQLLDKDPFGTPLTEGRVTTIETEHFFLTTVYTPNSKTDLSRLSLRHKIWDPLFLEYLKYLDQIKPIIVCGDLNVAHQEIDLARPKQNTKNAGFTNEEREGMSHFLESHLIDTFRYLHPDEQRFSWWSHWGHARENNIGWRIDYFLISEKLKKYLVSANIHSDIFGSDHCPISLTLNF